MRKMLIVVDMQNDFIDGALGTAEAVAIVDNVVKEIAKYPAENIIATRDTHEESYMDTREGKFLPVPHCIRGSHGWEIADAVKAALGSAKVLDKPTFGSVELMEHMAALSREDALDITLVGLCTDICVVSNAMLIKAALPEAEVSVIADCCAGVTPESHAAALKTMAMCQVRIL
ncbi:MAG: cysteine hydrolase [Oscillospiraceae bacterium]|nr:cysteine hydrolase [Oscillospiraceae bacterium]